MSYSFRNTFKKDENTFIEDRGYLHTMQRGDPDFATLETFFADVPVGSTTRRNFSTDDFIVEDGDTVSTQYKANRVAEIDAELQRLEADYLQPRTLSDLSLAEVPPAAAERKRLFEEKAVPLRVERAALVKKA